MPPALVRMPNGASPLSPATSIPSGDRTLRLWDVARKQPLGEPLKGHIDTVLGVAFQPERQAARFVGPRQHDVVVGC
jgi:WD40 repeat protein